MNFNDVKFAKLFSDKHGKHLFKEITTIIENEITEKCDNDYIEAIFKVAFMSYFGLDNRSLNRMLEDISCSTDIRIIRNIHKNSIRTIQKYIKDARAEK